MEKTGQQVGGEQGQEVCGEVEKCKGSLMSLWGPSESSRVLE